MKKTRKKLLAVLLAFTMLFGSSMTVFAQEYNWNELREGIILQNGDTISVTYDTLVECGYEYRNSIRLFFDTNWPPTVEGSNDHDTNFRLSYTVNNIETGKVFKVSETSAATPDSTTANFFVEGDIITNPAPQTPSTNPTNNKPIEEPTKIEEVHSHSYSWVTVQEAGAGQDGIEEYRCSCGAVAERNVIPAGMAMVKDLVRQIETAPENSTVEIKTEYFTCYTAYIMNALKKRPDVSLKTTFKDYDKDGSIKTFTIPAGKAPDDGELFYGFTYLGNLYGWE
ncbi:MAG: hypothetical protein SO154_09965 [Prevotella sp.]|nr:hypothetical protein [Prevotella sp.]